MAQLVIDPVRPGLLGKQNACDELVPGHLQLFCMKTVIFPIARIHVGGL
jgi:hypothetical protein